MERELAIPDSVAPISTTAQSRNIDTSPQEPRVNVNRGITERVGHVRRMLIVNTVAVRVQSEESSVSMA